MDFCSHPSLLRHRGQLLSNFEGPIPEQVMIPIFSYCSTTMHNNIVSAFKSGDPPDIDPDFEDRFDERLSWRGSTTGMDQKEYMRW